MASVTAYQFPFGRPVTPCKPSGDGRRRLFVLGAYPSALHVRWTPPSGFKPIAAVAVDNEPEPFWTGDDEVARVDAWKAAVNWQDTWGRVQPVGRLNGSSGKWVEEKVLGALGTARGEAWITDCLDTYRCSVDLGKRLEDTYKPFVSNTHRNLALHALAPHPSERQIVLDALTAHRERLLGEFEVAQPERVVTLGNAALSVLTGMVESIGAAAPRKLATKDYGRPLTLRLMGRTVEWLPLAHPAAPPAYQHAHDAWRREQPANGRP